MIYEKRYHIQCVIFFVICISKINCAFNYDNLGPDYWPNAFKECAGSTQSPIDIETDKTIYEPSLLPFNLANYEKLVQWNVSHDGVTGIIFDPLVDNSTKLKIDGSNFNEPFYLWKFHFHWGQNDYQGSEHLINGKKFPLELHLVHRSSKEFAVLGFLFTISPQDIDNPGLENLIKAVSVASKVSITTSANFSLLTILPPLQELKNYYRYKGSLTNPPCSEGLIWTVFETPIEISKKQMQAFRENQVDKNFREVQKLNGRKVYSSIRCKDDDINCLNGNFRLSFSIETIIFNLFIFFLIIFDHKF